MGGQHCILRTCQPSPVSTWTSHPESKQPGSQAPGLFLGSQSFALQPPPLALAPDGKNQPLLVRLPWALLMVPEATAVQSRGAWQLG